MSHRTLPPPVRRSHDAHAGRDAGKSLAIVVLALAVAVAPRARADIVHLTNGKQIEGKVTHDEAAGTFTIETPRGTVVKPASDVLRVESAPLPEADFETRFAKVPRDDLAKLAELAAWCREKRLDAQKSTVCRAILAIDPNHEMARLELGFVVFENEWILEKELRKKRNELGLVKHGGEWMTPEERARIELEANRAEIAALFQSVRSQNAIVLEYAVRKLMAYAGAHAYGLFEPYLDDPNEHVRLVAVSALSRFPVRKDPATGELDAGGVAVARRLFVLFLREPSEKVLEVLRPCLRRFCPDEVFRESIATLQRERDPDLTARAAELATILLLKRRVPDVLRALTSPADAALPAGAGNAANAVEHPRVRRLLVDTLGVDHGFDVESWLAWWRASESRFRDVP